MFLFFIIYYILRQTYSYNGSYVIIPSVTELGADFINLPITWFILVVMNVVLILQMIGKVCYFLKMYEKFGMLVQLIITCFQDVKPFTFFMIIWLVCFTLIFMLLGANNDVDQTYVHLDSFVGYFLLIWENSIGNINPPTYEFWIHALEQAKGVDSFHETGTYFIIYIIWIMWLGN